jgi:uroporphyrinogen decarboxylase
MTSRERLLAVLHGRMPDCVPCCPDISNMVPCRLTGKPFWQIYACQDPPLWKAHIDALKHFDIDGGFEMYDFVGGVFPSEPSSWERRIVKRLDDGGFIVGWADRDTGKWGPTVTVFTADTPPRGNIDPRALGLPAVPTEWEPMPEAKKWPTGLELWKLVREEMGDQGVVGFGSGGGTLALHGPEDIYAYYEDPKPFRDSVAERLAAVEAQIKRVASLAPRPDFLLCGGSGTLIWQTPEIFRELSLPVLKKVTEMACDLGIPTHVHSCGPEKELVRMAAEETTLTVIDPLEVPPMGDCDLADLKRRYGDKIVLKGNLHTTATMLHGNTDDVRAASRRAIDDAAAGGGFILSTGDQCGRDTPDENIRAMVETARTYGAY